MSQEGLADVLPPPQRLLFVTLCVGTGLAQALYPLLGLGMTGWPHLDVE